VLSDRERRVLEEIERDLLDAPAPDPDVELYAALAVVSGVFGVFFVTRWPVLSALLLGTAALIWRTGPGAGRPARRWVRRGSGDDADSAIT
jgi:hypothetical protein